MIGRNQGVELPGSQLGCMWEYLCYLLLLIYFNTVLVRWGAVPNSINIRNAFPLLIWDLEVQKHGDNIVGMQWPHFSCHFDRHLPSVSTDDEEEVMALNTSGVREVDFASARSSEVGKGWSYSFPRPLLNTLKTELEKHSKCRDCFMSTRGSREWRVRSI